MSVLRKSHEITPSDANNLDKVIAALYVGQGGDIKVELAADPSNPSPTPVVLKAVPTGTLLNLRIRKVHATGTTAQFLVGFSE